MSVVPKVTADPRTAALWAFLEGDRTRLARTLRGMAHDDLTAFRRELRELARSVDHEALHQWTAGRPAADPSLKIYLTES